MPVSAGIPRFPVPAEAAAAEGVFDRLAPVYESPLWFGPLYRFLGGPDAPADDRERVVDLLEPADAHVLDVACGTGRLTRRLAADAASVTGIDVSAAMLERARRSAARRDLERVSFARMSADPLWFTDDAFDRVVCTWALHVFPDPSAALAEARRVLRPGGRIVLTTVVDEYVFDLPGLSTIARETVGAEPFTLGELRALMDECGFDRIALDRRGAALFASAR